MERGDEWRGKERRLDGRPQRRFLDAPLITLFFHCIGAQVRIDRQVVRWRERERESDRAWRQCIVCRSVVRRHSRILETFPAHMISWCGGAVG